MSRDLVVAAHVRALLDRMQFLDGKIEEAGPRGFWVREVAAIAWALEQLDPDGEIADVARTLRR